MSDRSIFKPWKYIPLKIFFAENNTWILTSWCYGLYVMQATISYPYRSDLIIIYIVTIIFCTSHGLLQSYFKHALKRPRQHSSLKWLFEYNHLWSRNLLQTQCLKESDKINCINKNNLFFLIFRHVLRTREKLGSFVNSIKIAWFLLFLVISWRMFIQTELAVQKKFRKPCAPNDSKQIITIFYDSESHKIKKIFETIFFKTYEFFCLGFLVCALI